MNRLKKVFILIHIFAWGVFILNICRGIWFEGQSFWPNLSVGLLFTGLFVFYSHFFILTQYVNKKKYRAYFLRLTGIIITGPFPFLLFHHIDFSKWTVFLSYYAITILFVVTGFILISWLARVTQNLIMNTLKKEQLEKQAIEAELYYLKSQINPHFLFNTLNNIHTLVYKQAPAAPEAVLRLASLMRYMIYESNAPTVLLSLEIDYLQDYVALQQLRYKEAPVVDLEIIGDTSACIIAPLLFIHLLENAYKHSPARLQPGEIKVRMEILENTLTFKVENPVRNSPVNRLDEPGGIGLQNVQKRLQLLYPAKHSLEINNRNETFTVFLKIQGLYSQIHERKDHLLYN